MGLYTSKAFLGGGLFSWGGGGGWGVYVRGGGLILMLINTNTVKGL